MWRNYDKRRIPRVLPVRYCLYTNSNMKNRPRYLCVITDSKMVGGEEFIIFKPVNNTFQWGQKFISSEDIKLVDKINNPEVFL